MQPVRLTANKQEPLVPPSLVANTNGKFFCTIYADGNVTFDVTRDYSKDELEAIIKIQDQFFTIYNSIIEKDTEIEFLKEKNKTLMRELMLSINPVNERQ